MAGNGKYYTHIEPYLHEIPKHIRKGRKEEDIAKIYGVAYSTFKNYKKRHMDLVTALKAGKMTLLEDLEDTIYMKALGGKRIEKSKITYKYYKGKRIPDKEEVNIEIQQPDNTCMIASLKKLDKDWRDALNNNPQINLSTDNEKLQKIADTLETLGSNGIDTSQFDDNVGGDS